MDKLEPFIAFAVALGTGLLIGLQREQSAAEEGRPEGHYSGGIRTYPIVALAGGISMMLAEILSPWIFAVAFLGVLAPVVVGYLVEVRSGGDRGVTSEVTFAVTFLLGGLALSKRIPLESTHRLLVVGAVGVATTALLSFKQPLHRLASRVSRQDLYSTVKFLVLAVIILPLLPNEDLGPLKILNPFTIGLMIVLLAGVGFVAYVAIRLAGPGRGLEMTGLVGGLISSTAVAFTVSGRARKSPALAVSGALAVVLASTVMIVRMAILISATNAGLLIRMGGMLGAMGVAGGLGCLGLYLAARRFSPERVPEEDIPFKNPFELSQAFKFGFLFMVILVASKAATHYLGGAGAYLAGAVGGLMDVDGVTLSLSQLARSTLPPGTAALGILIAAASNSVVKGIVAIALGGWRFGRWVVLVFALTIGAGIAVVVIGGR
jgi:uncharacterized membrane protein (DUF4010 family)